MALLVIGPDLDYLLPIALLISARGRLALLSLRVCVGIGLSLRR